MARFERMLSIMERHNPRIVVLGNDCSRVRRSAETAGPGPQPQDLGVTRGTGSSRSTDRFRAIGYTSLDDPELNPKFFQMCEELLMKYRDDDCIAFGTSGTSRATTDAERSPRRTPGSS